ncbi:nuclear transport factor 2 family protein [Cupriavidus sp. UYPR2.512]|uniref:nuclear transport factor 2 family protein n=1 Tax=Cupriavidus sp. UYPR2.512 TaxID=1080187 RepID=UPI00037BC18A|nr:nuclear transport factor 2 family protein [Cupriavidus sp. UYPR2.512]UIF89915.1 nuclear transport factor 2 family protein [Cupriavidus necator]
MSELEHKQAIHALTCRYAQAVDRRDFARLAEVFSPDARLTGPGFRMDGAQAIVDGMASLGQYSATQHHVHQQMVVLDGDTATGETYCVANHLYEQDGVPRKLDWGIRYQDRFERSQGQWRIAARELVVDWTQDLPLRGACP